MSKSSEIEKAREKASRFLEATDGMESIAIEISTSYKQLPNKRYVGTHYKIRVAAFCDLRSFFLNLERLCEKNSFARYCYMQQIYKFVETSLTRVHEKRSWSSMLNGAFGFTITFKTHMETFQRDLERESWQNEEEYASACAIATYLTLYFSTYDVL